MVKSVLSNLQSVSVLDRLIDQDPEKHKDGSLNQKELISQLIGGIQRDLLNILNTRKRFLSFPPMLKELNSSIIEYGMEDFTNYLSFSAPNQGSLCADIEKAISLYETRLKNVKVTLELGENTNRVIPFTIEAQLNAREILYPLFIRVSLNTQTNTYKIEGAL